MPSSRVGESFYCETDDDEKYEGDDVQGEEADDLLNDQRRPSQSFTSVLETLQPDGLAGMRYDIPT